MRKESNGVELVEKMIFLMDHPRVLGMAVGLLGSLRIRSVLDNVPLAKHLVVALRAHAQEVLVQEGVLSMLGNLEPVSDIVCAARESLPDDSFEVDIALDGVLELAYQAMMTFPEDYSTVIGALETIAWMASKAKMTPKIRETFVQFVGQHETTLRDNFYSVDTIVRRKYLEDGAWIILELTLCSDAVFLF